MPRKRRDLADALEISALIVLALFAVFYLNAWLGGWLNAFGIIPRTRSGLLGIIFSPLLHGSVAHLTANAVGLFVLLVVIFSHHEYKPDQALIAIWLASGFGTWLIGRGMTAGRPTVHIGASSIIYGLVVYIVATAWWRRSWNTIFTAIIILFMYGGIVYGMLPQQGVISWEGHLSGAIAGYLIARRYHA